MILHGVLNKMATSCKNICQMFKGQGVSMKNKYQNGQKRCSLCGIFMKYGGIRCPCCKTILRTKPRNSLTKNKD
jgi:uncharacterized paraquat-inducible protein A